MNFQRAALKYRSDHWLASACLFAAFMLAIQFYPINAQADRIPGTALSGRYIYFSGDMRPVDILLTHPNEAFHREISLPRALINFASGYEDPPHETLPARMETDQLSIMMTFDGDPIAVAANDLVKAEMQRVQREGSKNRRRFGTESAIRVLRPDTTWMRVRTSLFTAEREKVFFETRKKHVKRKTYNKDINMLEYRFVDRADSGPRFYGNHRDDEYIRINCLSGSHNAQYCSYFFFLDRNIVITASFLDLRHHGGREFANVKIRKIRKALCQRINCNGIGDDGEFLLWHGIETGE